MINKCISDSIFKAEELRRDIAFGEETKKEMDVKIAKMQKDSADLAGRIDATSKELEEQLVRLRDMLQNPKAFSASSVVEETVPETIPQADGDSSIQIGREA